MFNLQMLRGWIYLESSKTMLKGRNQAKPLAWLWVAWICIPFARAMMLEVASGAACIVQSLTATTPNELAKPGLRTTSWLWAAPLTTWCRYKDRLSSSSQLVLHFPTLGSYNRGRVAMAMAKFENTRKITTWLAQAITRILGPAERMRICLGVRL